MKKESERRVCRDRREREYGPPKNFPERRRAPDRRRPEIVEATFLEWASLFVKYQKGTGSHEEDKAADVLGRSR